MRNVFVNGFTLAEVLVTLGIIGVVAAMTMPTLLNNTGNQQFVAKLKKVNSVLGQATIRAVEDHGMIEDWGIKDGSADNLNRIFDYYKPYFNIVQDCENDVTNPCTADTQLLSLAGNGIGWSNAIGMGSGVRSFVLSDGTAVLMDAYSNKEDSSLFGVTRNKLSNFIIFLVDVNGDKKPNRLGRDVFIFLLTQEGIIPAGADVDDTKSDCKLGGTGYHCAAKVISEGDMNY